jgi:hypothetical protein
VLCRKTVAVYCGLRAELGNSLRAQNAEHIKAKAGGMYSYRYVVNVKFSLHEIVVTISDFLSLKCRLFDNATLFSSSIIHILNTGCAKFL